MALSWVQQKIWTSILSQTTQGVLNAIETAMTSSTYWMVISSGPGFLEIGPKTGSNILNFRILIVGDSTGPNVAQCQSPATATANILYVSIAPDNGSFSGNWNSSSNPYGVSRFSKYWKVLNPNIHNRLRIIECEEIFEVVFNDTNTIFSNVIAGSIIKPMSVSSAEADGRIYGMMSMGTASITTTFWNESQGFLDSGSMGTGEDSHPWAGVFKWENPNTWAKIRRRVRVEVISTGTGNLTNAISEAQLYPMIYSYYDAPYSSVGTLNGMVVGPNTLDAQDATSNAIVVAMCFAPSNTTTVNSLYHRNT